MPLWDFDQLYRHADHLGHPVPVAVAGGAEPTVLASLRSACDRGWVAPIVVGRMSQIRAIAEAEGADLHGFSIIDAEDSAAAAVAAVRQNKRPMLLMKGQVSTPALMRVVLDADSGLRQGGDGARVICQVVLMQIRPAGRRLLLADTGICIRPTFEQKVGILQNTVKVAHALGENLPKVAVLAAAESPTQSMPDTLEAAELQRLSQSGAIRGCVAQGPLSFDLAYAAEAGQRKQVDGPVIGAADILLFPDLVSANLTVKAIMYTADCRFGGVLCGANCPIVFMSRSDSTATRLNSLALARTLISSAVIVSDPL